MEPTIQITKFGTEEGDECNRGGCKGVMGFGPVEGCSCHINPPCSRCVNNPCVCLACGEAVVDEMLNGFEMKVERSTRLINSYKRRELDSTKIDFHTFSHTHFSQIHEGVYPNGTTKSEVLAKVKGTFGGRFTSFGSGKFKYIAYTD